MPPTTGSSPDGTNANVTFCGLALHSTMRVPVAMSRSVTSTVTFAPEANVMPAESNAASHPVKSSVEPSFMTNFEKFSAWTSRREYTSTVATLPNGLARLAELESIDPPRSSVPPEYVWLAFAAMYAPAPSLTSLNLPVSETVELLTVFPDGTFR